MMGGGLMVDLGGLTHIRKADLGGLNAIISNSYIEPINITGYVTSF